MLLTVWTAKLGIAIRIAELEVRLASEILALRKQERTNEERSKETHKIRLALLKEKIDWITPHAKFSDEDLQDQLLEIDKRESDRKRLLKSAQYSLQYIERQWFNARAQLDTADNDVPALVEDVEAKRLARQMRQQQIAVINLQLQRLGSIRETWIRRYKVITGAADIDELIAWRPLESIARVGGTADFAIRFEGQQRGFHSAVVSFTTGDGNENPISSGQIRPSQKFHPSRPSASLFGASGFRPSIRNCFPKIRQKTGMRK